MHDKPGVIVVKLGQPSDALKQELDDALDSGAELLFANDSIAVFARGYSGK